MPDATTVRAALCEWLRVERRLGLRHVPVVGAGPAVAPGRVAGGGGAGAAAATAVAGSPAAASTNSARPASPARAPARTVLPLPLAIDDGLPPLCREELAPEEAARRLAELDAAHVRGCRKCGLHARRTQTVFGVGNPRPRIVFVGEGPGADEDAQGEPFVGKAGQLLTRMIAAMSLTREQVYICNVVKCRPPGNRTPEPDEMDACAPYLLRQLAILRPEVIVALGRPAAQTLLATTTPISQLRGEFHDFPPPALARPELAPSKLMPTFHPSYLLRRPDEKGKAWSDLKQVMRVLGLGGAGSS